MKTLFLIITFVTEFGWQGSIQIAEFTSPIDNPDMCRVAGEAVAEDTREQFAGFGWEADVTYTCSETPKPEGGGFGRR